MGSVSRSPKWILFHTPIQELEMQFDQYNHGFSNKVVGDKRYELTNHLGNVLSVISDKKLVTQDVDTQTDFISLFRPDVLTYNDYYPFGMLVPNRHQNTSRYRYGFQGQEMDNEIKGVGNSLDFGERMYDPRVGRWFTPDKKFFKQPSWSTYKAFYNNPLLYVDPDGNTEWQVTKVVNHQTGKTTMIFEVINENKLDQKIINVKDYYHKKYDIEFSDIIHNNTITIYQDGTLKEENHSTQYAKRYERSYVLRNIPEMPSINFQGDSQIKIKDGYVFTSEWVKDGIALQNKGNRNGKEIDMSALEAVTSIIRGGKLP